MAEDKILTCKDCGQQFPFTVGEQEFYTQKGFQNEPARCAPCRRNRKKERASIEGVQYRDRQPLGQASFGTDYGRSRY